MTFGFIHMVLYIEVDVYLILIEIVNKVLAPASLYKLPLCPLFDIVTAKPVCVTRNQFLFSDNRQILGFKYFNINPL